MAISMSELSTEYLFQPVYVTSLGQPYDPTGDLVQFAFKPPNVPPASGDWLSGAWWAGQQPDGAWTAEVLVGPENNGNILTPGIYAIWLKVTDNPEVPVRVTGQLEITP